MPSRIIVPSYKRFIVNANSLPADLGALLEKPKELADHPLSPYVNSGLIPNADIAVFLLQDFNWFYNCYLAEDSKQFYACEGAYCAIPHVWATPISFYYVGTLLRGIYSIKKDELCDDMIIMPMEDPRYLSFVHEYLHAVFNRLPEKTIEKIDESAVDSYTSIDGLLRFTGLKRKQVLETAMPRAMLFDLPWRKRLRCLDEFIAHYFTTDRGIDRNNPEYLPEQFKNDLSAIGYNMFNPPDVHLNIPELLRLRKNTGTKFSPPSPL